MEQGNYTLARPACLSLPVEEIDRLLRERDGACALVYLALQRGAEPTPQALGLTELELRETLRRLERLGLVAARRAPVPPAAELPQYTAQDLVTRTREDAGFQAVLLETERLYGRKLTTPETQMLLGMYDYLGFPAEVLLELVNYVFEEYRAAHGPGRVPTMRMVEREAYDWARAEALTPELAEEYIKSRRARKARAAQALETVGIRGRTPTPTERRYIDAWLDMGFEPDALAEAYDRTVVSTGGLKWRYMDTILTSWHKKGLHTPAEIQQGDPRGGQRRAAKPAPGKKEPPRDDLERATRMLREMKEKQRKV